MYKKDPLWLRIQTFEMDASNSPFPFSRKLAKENKWTYEFTLKAIEEYKRFVYLCCISPRGASPSPIVDQVWHLHLIYTDSYWNEFCPKILQRQLHHYPSKGGASETLKYDSLYEDTVILYRQTFDEDPPLNYWSPPKINARILNLNGWNFETKYTEYLVFLLPFMFIQVFYHKLNPYSLNGPQFLFYFFILICCTGLFFYRNYKKHKELVQSILASSFNILNPFELAYIVRGKSAYQQMILVDFIEQEKIVYQNELFYLIQKENISKSFNPLNKILQEFPDEQIEFVQIMNLAYTSAYELDEKYPSVKFAYFETWIDLLPQIIISILCIMRIFQGSMHHKPIGYLILMLIAFNFIMNSVRTLIKSSSLYSDLLRSNGDYTSHRLSDAQRLLLFSGATSLLALPMFIHLDKRPFFNDKIGDSSSGCGSGCSGGGGCGGGCGGCGG